MSSDEHKRRVMNRLKRAAGQVRGVHQMVEGDEPALAVLQQIAAVRAALAQASLLVLRGHMERELPRAFRSESTPLEQQTAIDSLIRGMGGRPE